MTALDTLVVTTALSTIRRDLGASVEELEWTVNAYNLSFAVLLMTAAALGDRLRPAARLRRRHRALRRRLGGLRGGALGRRADRRPRRPGRRRRRGDDAGPGAGRRRLPAGEARRRARHLLRRQRARGRGRAAGRRRDHPGDRLAVDLLAERADRAGADPAGAARGSRRATAPTRTLDLPGLALVSGGVLGLVWGLVRGNDAGWGSAEVLGAFAAAVVLAGRLRRGRAADAGADAADALLPLARLLGRQRGDLLRGRRPLLRGLLHGPVPPGGARLRPARRRPAAAALDGDALLRRPGGGQAGRPLRRAAVPRSSGRCCRRSASAGSPWSPKRGWTTGRWCRR